jgi:transcriptional regulator with XRE-family HTH domain
MPQEPRDNGAGLRGHALRNFHLRERSLARAESAPPLAREIVRIRATALGMTRLELARRSGIGRGTLRDLELGIHTPTRNTLQRFLDFCQQRGVTSGHLEVLRRLYAGSGESLGELVARFELQAGSTRELARRVGISASTLWEYRRGNFPMPWKLLKSLCAAVGQDPAAIEPLWLQSERHRLVTRGYPPAWAEFCALAGRAGVAENRLLQLGLRTAALRRLRYLELPAWEQVAKAARALCRDDRELAQLKKLWLRDAPQFAPAGPGSFGLAIKRLREEQATERRELADLFGIGGKKPARIIKYIEEDGFYSVQAYPAGLAAVLTSDRDEQDRLLELWAARRRQFHRRHRPETRIELRLARERYGFELGDMQQLLGYSSLEYQRIERGVESLLSTAELRIIQAMHDAGERRVRQLLEHRRARAAEREAWRAPSSVANLITQLARREGGMAPLSRLLRRQKLTHTSTPLLRAVSRGETVPAWPHLEQIGRACAVEDLSDLRHDWADRFREQLRKRCESPIGVEVRLLIAEVAPTVRDFSRRLPFNYSVLVRDLQRLDRDVPLKWFHVERILRAAELPADCERWQEIHALWYTMDARQRKASWRVRRPQPPTTLRP